MADDQNAQSENNEGGAAPQTPPQTPAEPPYQIIMQYVKDFSFENPGAPGIFTSGAAPQTAINLDVTSQPLGGRDIEVTLKIDAQAAVDGKAVYILELAYSAVVRVGNVPKEALNALVLVEVPRMLFPFAREIVSSTTRNGGYSSLLLAPFDFVQLYRRHMEQAQKAGGDAAVAQPEAADTAQA
ncbi:protein-export chaperone SecB [Rhodospirillaceae bacterium KN72]|uniref:Protein-export protein SecB n=1 Tax=Pacificispira spongiicola TaxID=2729598 RepID=A0A7Y0HEM8_9PROT|nr:protein-export chaperone SecB [Pacificispira spongiicola]NMM45036.1 protein-export chaperone SecB [Pacificispira spongiicola]